MPRRLKRESASYANLSRAAAWVGNHNVDAPPAVQDKRCIDCLNRLVQNAALGLDLPIRRSGASVKIAVDLVSDLAKLSPFLEEKRPLTVKRPEVLDRFWSKRSHFGLP
jgi:hypothetical protein